MAGQDNSAKNKYILKKTQINPGGCYIHRELTNKAKKSSKTWQSKQNGRYAQATKTTRVDEKLFIRPALDLIYIHSEFKMRVRAKAWQFNPRRATGT